MLFCAKQPQNNAVACLQGKRQQMETGSSGKARRKEAGIPAVAGP